jgi:YHS domain-containing protein
MLRLILFIVSTVILYAILHFLIKDMSSNRKRTNRSMEPEELVQDPCCQTYIPKRLAIRKTVAGKEYYFCNQDCLRNYLKSTKPQED